jgi:predicted peptidase
MSHCRRFCLACTWVVAAIGCCSQAGAQSQPPTPNPDAPLYQHTGEQYRVYDFPGTGESIPYRLFVPGDWAPGIRLPVLVTLRAGRSVNNNHRRGNDLVREAAQRGYIVISPLGYRPLPQPYYGSRYAVLRPNGPSVPAQGWSEEEDTRAEQDVLNVIDLVVAEYGADSGRIYIHGQNPSGSGALHLIAKYPERFAGAVISSAPIDPATYPFERIRGKVPLFIIHGDADTSNPIEASREFALAARTAGVDAQFFVVPGGEHLTAYLDFASEIYDFLDSN